jgi:hypothetical protein
VYHFKLNVKSHIVHPFCLPTTRCTNVYTRQLDGTLRARYPATPTSGPGFLRDAIISARECGQFDGIGPGIDLEMDTARRGPIARRALRRHPGY